MNKDEMNSARIGVGVAFVILSILVALANSQPNVLAGAASIMFLCSGVIIISMYQPPK